jgi:hypothetical protein
VAEAQQPARRRKAQGKPSERAPRERAGRSAAKAPKEPESSAAVEAAGAPELGREELVARDLLAPAPWGGPSLEPAAEAALARPVQVFSPVHAIVDRRDLLAVFSIDTKVVANGQVRAVLRRPFGHPAGRLPGDPGPFSSAVDPRLGVCHVLSPAAAARCLGGGRYFR